MAQPPQGPGQLPILRRALENEVVIAPVDQYGRQIETAWVVDSVGMHWVKTHLLQDPQITRTLKHSDIALTGRDAENNEIKVEPREFHLHSGPQPLPSVTKQRSRVIDGQVQLVDVTENPNDRSVRGPDGIWRPESQHRGLRFSPPMSLNETWRVEAADVKTPTSKKMFRESDGEGFFIIPRVDIPSK
jgi:hypothetical protein